MQHSHNIIFASTEKEIQTKLVLTRCADDSIQIGDDVEITVLEIKGNQVKIGINAPRELEVHRSEVFAKINYAPYDEPLASR